MADEKAEAPEKAEKQPTPEKAERQQKPTEAKTSKQQKSTIVVSGRGLGEKRTAVKIGRVQRPIPASTLALIIALAALQLVRNPYIQYFFRDIWYSANVGLAGAVGQKTSGGSPPPPPSADLGTELRAFLWWVIAAVIVLAIADEVPYLVNGFLILIMVGLVITHSSDYLPLLMMPHAFSSGNQSQQQQQSLADYNASHPGYMPATGTTPGGIPGVQGTGKDGTINADPAPKGGWGIQGVQGTGKPGTMNADPAPSGGWWWQQKK